jgi:PAS domain S-box-containing protein
MEPENDIITGDNRAGEVRQGRLWFLESLDQINRAIQDTDDFEQMGHVLDAVLSIFRCNRAWVSLPCDPETGIWRTMAERARPEWGDVSSIALDLPMDPEVARAHRVVRASKGAVQFGTGTSDPVPSAMERFGVQSQMCVAVLPKSGEPHIFGLDQCTSVRSWTEQEQSLFEATGQRLATLLTSLLLSRDLQESRARLEEAQRVAHVGYWVWDLETNRVIWSTYRIFGLKPQEGPIDLTTVREKIHPDDREEVFRIADEAVRSGARADSEHRVIRPNGEVRIVHSLGDLKKDSSGRAYQMFGTIQDITDRKRAEEALQRTQCYLSEGERLAHMGSWASSKLGTSWSNDLGLYWSDEVYRIFGLDPKDGTPSLERCLALVHPQDRAFMAETVRAMHEQRRGCDVTHRIVRLGGEVRYIRCVANPVIEQGVFKSFVGITIDVTEQELLTQELRRQQAYLAEAQSLTHVGSWACNFLTGKIFHLSDEALRLYGFDPGSPGISFDRLYNATHPEDEPTLRERFYGAVHARSDYDLEYRIYRRDGAIRCLRSLGHHDPSQEIGEYVGITMDITERKRAEEEHERLHRLEADLAHINRVNMMGELAAALAHEIKQPIAASITSANACLRWLAHVPPDLERARAAAARIEQEGNRAADIINSLRSFYKTGTPSERQSIDVKGAIREMIALLGTEAARHSVTIRAESEADMPPILADRVQLQQVLMNLMLNAIEAMKDTGGELTIRSGVNPEGHLTVSISDSGVGLPAEGADLMFDPFHTTKPQGTGMGLTITRSIVESYGGRVWATANEGPGATFQFTLPTGAEAHA